MPQVALTSLVIFFFLLLVSSFSSSYGSQNNLVRTKANNFSRISELVADYKVFDSLCNLSSSFSHTSSLPSFYSFTCFPSSSSPSSLLYSLIFCSFHPRQYPPSFPYLCFILLCFFFLSSSSSPLSDSSLLLLLLLFLSLLTHLPASPCVPFQT